MGTPATTNSREYRNFEHFIDTLLAVPRYVIDERIKEHRARAAANPLRRGPKTKTP